MSSSGGHATGGATTSTTATSSSGGTITTGGTSAAATIQTGGTTTTGGSRATGGIAATGGSKATGGLPSNGGSAATGGALPTGGSKATGGAVATGGTKSTGGSLATGGQLATGGATGNPTYLFSTFGSASHLLIYTSSDGLNFTLLSDSGYGGPTTYLRDPSIMKHSDGKYYAAFTTPPTIGCCGAQSSFSIGVSSDLNQWTTLTTVNAGVTGSYNTWAPEWFKDTDGSVNLIVSVDTTAASSFRSYKYTALNSALTSWSGPTPIGIGPNYIDTFIVMLGTTYHAFTKNEDTLYIEHATASSLAGPWTFVGTGDWAGWGVHREAPAVFQLPNGNWRIFVDGGSQGHEMYSDSSNNFGTWTALRALPTIGATVSHGTVIRVN